MPSSGDTADAKAITSWHGRQVMAFLLHATVKSARAVLDSRAAGRYVVFGWFAVTVTAAKWEIPAKTELAFDESADGLYPISHSSGGADGCGCRGAHAVGRRRLGAPFVG